MSESDFIYLCFLEFGYFYFIYVYIYAHTPLLCHSAVFLERRNVRGKLLCLLCDFLFGERVPGFRLLSLPNERPCESASAALFYVTPDPVVS